MVVKFEYFQQLVILHQFESEKPDLTFSLFPLFQSNFMPMRLQATPRDRAKCFYNADMCFLHQLDFESPFFIKFFTNFPRSEIPIITRANTFSS